MRTSIDQTTPLSGTAAALPRRAVLAGLACSVPAAAVAAGQHPMNTALVEGTRLDDPIFAAIEKYRLRLAACDRSSLELDRALSALSRVAPRRPNAIVRFGNSVCASAQEIEEERDRRLAEARMEPEQVEAAYRTVRKQYAEALRAERDWDRRFGVAELSRKAAQASRASADAELEIAMITPTTMAGVVALLDQILADDHYGFEASTEWGIAALENIAAVLPRG